MLCEERRNFFCDIDINACLHAPAYLCLTNCTMMKFAVPRHAAKAPISAQGGARHIFIIHKSNWYNIIHVTQLTQSAGACLQVPKCYSAKQTGTAGMRRSTYASLILTELQQQRCMLCCISNGQLAFVMSVLLVYWTCQAHMMALESAACMILCNFREERKGEKGYNREAL